MSEPTALEPRLESWRPRVGRRIGRVLFHSLYRIRTIGADLVPAEGPVVLVANHTGLLDGPFVFTVAPRPSHFLVKQQIFHGPLGWLFIRVGQIPVDRSIGDRRALLAARTVLERGGAVGVFPEGTRGRGDVAQVHQGATWLVLQSGARVVPVACLGTRATGAGRGSWPRLRSPLVAVFGEPFELTPDPALPGRERMRVATEQLRAGLAGHVTAAAEQLGMALPADTPEPGRG